MKKVLFVITTFLLIYSPVYAATYYVDGKIAGDCNGINYHYDPATRTRKVGAGQIAWQHVASANPVLTAGDTVYIRGGKTSFEVYNIGDRGSATGGIDPENSGTDANNRITYAVYPGEKVHFKGNHASSKAVYIEDQDWIHVTGYDGSTSARNFKFSNMYHFLRIWSASSTGGAGSDYNEVDHCEFTTNNGTTTDYRGSTIYRNSQYNWVHDCTFSHFGFYTTKQDGGALFELGWEGSTNDDTAYNVIEDNEFFHGGHHTLGIHRMYNVVRNNHLHNERWWYNSANGQYYGYRNIYAAGYTGNENHGTNLIEGNRISHASPNVNPNNSGGNGIALNQANTIVRYNELYANQLKGVYIQCGSGEDCNSNHIYNNTFFSNGYIDPNVPLKFTESSIKRRPIVIWSGSNSGTNFPFRYMDNAIKNNLMWKNMKGQEGQPQILPDVIGGWSGCSGYEVCGNTVIENNWEDKHGDPEFYDEGPYRNPSISDPDFKYSDPYSVAEADLRLKSTSPCINEGTHLTAATNSGNSSTTLKVSDARYFQPGWGDGAGGGASVNGDWIAIGTVANTIEISAINYSTNTITLKSAKTWSNGAKIWLFKKSDGEAVLIGLGPDIGANENSGGGTYIQTPRNLRVVSSANQ